MERITKEELLEMLFHDDYEHLKGKKLRMTRVRVPGKEVCMAHIISRSDEVIYQNLGLHIGPIGVSLYNGHSLQIANLFSDKSSFLLIASLTCPLIISISPIIKIL